MKARKERPPEFQELPASWEDREELREKGQFWTPPWLAKVMAEWVIADGAESLFDPAVGPGTFFAAARDLGYTGGLDGYELDKSAFADGVKIGLEEGDFEQVIIGDFIVSGMKRSFSAIISNPPYIRHHRLSKVRKAELRLIAERVLGFALDARVGVHVYFLLKCLEHLAPKGRLAFLLPADVCEGVSSKAFWKGICERFRIEAVITFAKSAAPFPRVDTNAMVFLISNLAPSRRLKWLRVKERDKAAVTKALSQKRGISSDAVVSENRELSEALETGFSRPVRSDHTPSVPLSRFARVVRGIATGANELFFLTRAQMKAARLESRFFIRAIGRTRDCTAPTLDAGALERLDEDGRPSWLLYLDDTPKERLPPAMRGYLQSGEKLGIHERALIKMRRPWYKMERRLPPPILFAYLGRRDCRFILNKTDAVPLTGFLCVYPSKPEEAERLWRALNHPETLANLSYVGKSYGGGAVKVEPRQLDELEIPVSVLHEAGLEIPEPGDGAAVIRPRSR